MTESHDPSLRNIEIDKTSIQQSKYNREATTTKTVQNESVNNITAEVTPDRPPKQTKSKPHSEDQIKQESPVLSSPGRSGSGLNHKKNRYHAEDPGTSPSSYNQHRHFHNRHFPSTPQYDQIYATEPDSDSHKSTRQGLSFVQDSPLRIRRANSVETSIHKRPYHDRSRNLFSHVDTMTSENLKPQSKGTTYGNSYPQFGGIPSSPQSYGGRGEKGDTEKEQQLHVIENEKEVEVVLKSPPHTNKTNFISSASSSPERRVRRRPYTQMTRGDFPDRRENVIVDATTKDKNQTEVPTLNNSNAGKKIKSPPRHRTGITDGSKSMNVVSPPEEGHHFRSPSFNNMLIQSPSVSVPESPYNSVNQGAPDSPYTNSNSHASNTQRAYFKYPPSSPVKSAHPSESSSGFPNTEGAGSTTIPPNYYSPYPTHHQQGQPSDYYPEESYRSDGVSNRSSPGKRQRVTEAENNKLATSTTASYDYPSPPYTSQNLSQRQRSSHYPMCDQHPPVPESFDSEMPYSRKSGEGTRPAAPPVLKASSYPPPPSPRNDDVTGGSSAASYPGAAGAERPTAACPPPPHHGGGSGARYSNVPSHMPHGMPYQGDYYYGGEAPCHPGPPPRRMTEYQQTQSERKYYADPHRPHIPPQGAFGAEYYEDYYHNSPHQPHETQESPEVHPLLRDYDPDRDRRITTESTPSKSSPPPRTSPTLSSKTKKVKNSPSPIVREEATTSCCTPEGRKTSTAAHAAIAAGMTLPPSAQEVDFDIHNPPMKPVVEPSEEPVCSIASNINAHDVLCGRGGGTNTQIGNRRFRALVQEFQPIYLLCRRKEKPLIARTIVLIIRNRGGRFLKKDDLLGLPFEVGDLKAEAKTSQALREGLDVRASKGSSVDPKRKSRKKKSSSTNSSNSSGNHQPTHRHQTSKSESHPYAEDVSMTDHSQRDGPPAFHEGYHTYPYYYGGGGAYEDYYHGTSSSATAPGRGGAVPYDQHPHPPPYTPSRKRQRPPPGGGLYHYPLSATSYKGSPGVMMGGPYAYTSHVLHQNHLPTPHSHPGHPSDHHEYYHLPHHGGADEDHSVWEMDFSPPRGRGFKREDGGPAASVDGGIRRVEEEHKGYHVQDHQ